jgi:hypothetical protein
VNYYAIMLFLLFSPWGWLLIGTLASIFIFANLKFNITTNVIRRMTTVDPDDPQPDNFVAYMREEVKRLPRSEKPWFWFCILAATGVGLIIIVGFPLFFTYSGYSINCP